MTNLIAQVIDCSCGGRGTPERCIEKCANSSGGFFGTIAPPAAIEKYGDIQAGGIGIFINRMLNVLVIGAGVYAVFNLVMAGYGFMSAGDDPKKMAASWAKIYQTLLGLAFAAGAFVLAAIFGQLIFGDWDALLKPVIPTP